jgi:Xaa-Pro dipeptidase
MKMDMTRIEKVIEDMRKMNLEQFLVTDPMAVYYLTGQYYACGERMMVLRLDVEKEPVLVIGKLFPQDEEKLGIKVVYFDDTDDCVEVLASHMRKGGTIGIDKTWPARFLLRLMELQVGDAYSNASTIIDHIRQIKTEEEQQKMRVASRCNDTSIEELIPLVSKGMTEAELGEELLKIYLKNGAHAADPHHETDDSKGSYGDAVVLDVGCLVNGYCADMTRTVFIGKASEEAKKIYAIVKEANRRGIEAAKPGARMCDVDLAARNYIEEKGFGEYFTHRTGHSIGLEDHEFGDVSSVNTDIIQVGQCFSVEPGIYLPDENIGVRIEDLVIITEDGCEVLNDFTKDLIIVPEE